MDGVSPGVDVRRSAPLTFLLLVTVLSVPFFVLGAVTDGIRIGSLELPASAVMFTLPVIVAAILVARADGRAAVARLLRRAVDFRAAPRTVWFLVAVGVPAAVALISVAVAGASNLIDLRMPIVWWMIPIVVAGSLFAAACEELGWTGYATDPLQRRYGTVGTGIGLGLFWAVWHLVPLLQVGHELGWIAGWFVGTVALRCVIVWLHNNTGYGVSAAILMHATSNVTVVLTPDYDKTVGTVLPAVLTTAVATVVLWPRRLSR